MRLAIVRSIALAAIFSGGVLLNGQALQPTGAKRAAVDAKSVAREIDFTQTLTGVDGKPMLNADQKDAPLTLSDVAVTALNAQFDVDRTSTYLAKYKLGELASRIYKNAHARLTAEDIATLKDRIGRGWPPGVVFPAVSILDPNEGK